jgi:hypothetical protein
MHCNSDIDWSLINITLFLFFENKIILFYILKIDNYDMIMSTHQVDFFVFEIQSRACAR